jgi:TM2 domain-containing membrane protein YozV
MKAPIPYKGNEKYIFISYSHRDEERVYPIITELIEAGYRVWYDSGIDPGTEWDENIAEHIQQCGYFIAFISEHYLASSNCKDELNYVRDLEKERLIVYLEQVELPSGLAMRINRLQSIYKHRYTKESEFYEKLFSAKGIEACLDESAKKVAPKAQTEVVEESKEEPKAEPSPEVKEEKQPEMSQQQMWEAMMQSMFEQKKREEEEAKKSEPVKEEPKQQPTGSTSTPPPSQGSTFTPPPIPGRGVKGAATVYNLPQRNKVVALILAILLGTVGGHDFYLRRPVRGVLKIIGCFTPLVFLVLIWQVIDIVRIASNKTTKDGKGIDIKLDM